MAETTAALDVARTLPYECLVLHLGQSDTEDAPDDNHPKLARRSLEHIAAHASDVGIRVAVEILPNALSTAAALVDLVEDRLDGLDVGVCLDYGHAHLMGDLPDTVEALSGHLFTIHLHDNRGQRDEHLVPFAGTIDLDAAITTTQKVGYDGVFVFEINNAGDPLDVLRRCEAARDEFQRRFITC